MELAVIQSKKIVKKLRRIGFVVSLFVFFERVNRYMLKKTLRILFKI